MSLFLCLSGISLGRYCRKSLAKSGAFRKNIKRGREGGWSYKNFKKKKKKKLYGPFMVCGSEGVQTFCTL